jgi:hypothetical protein
MAKKILQLDIDASGAITSVKSLGDELEKVEKTTKDAGSGGFLSGIEKVSPRAAGAIRGVGSGIQGLVGGFKSLRVAIMATGIGALVVVLGSLVAYFTKTKRGAELLERATAMLGAVVSTVTDAAAGFGETLVNAFNNPREAVANLWEAIKTNFVNRLKGVIENAKAFGRVLEGVFNMDWDEIKAGAEDFGRSLIQISTGLDRAQQDAFVDGLVEMGNQMKANAEAADKLTQANQRLRDNQRALNVETARSRADIKELNKIAEDTTKTYEERIAAAEKAGELEEQLMKRRLALAAENVRIIAAQNALSESTEEDLDRLADAEVELANIRMESMELQTTLQNKVNTIRQTQENERLAALKAAADEELRIFTEMEEVRQALVTEGIEKEIAENVKKYDDLFAKANGNHELEKMLLEQQQMELNAIEDKYRDEAAQKEQARIQEEFATYKTLQDSKLGLASATIDAISSLADLAAGDNEKRARKAFAISKALSLAEAAASTYAAINATLKDPTIPSTALRVISAVTIGAKGLANVAKIAATKFGGGASGGAGGGGGLNLSAPPNPTAVPQIGLNFGQQNQQAPIPAYVIGSQVQNDMEARTRVNDLAKL